MNAHDSSLRSARPHGLAGLVLLLCLGSWSSQAATLVQCAAYSPGGDHIRRGFYIQRYPGTDLRGVTIYLSSTASGSHTFSLTARAGSYDGPVLGTATATATLVAAAAEVPVEFVFPSAPAVEPGTVVAFQAATVSAPSQSNQYLGCQALPPCAVVETAGTEPPLSVYRRSAIPITVVGTGTSREPETLTVPASASIHGQNQSFFHSDLWVMNRSKDRPADVTARFRCFVGQSCGTASATFSLAPRESRLFADALVSLFGAPETAGAIELTYEGSQVQLSARSRVYTPSMPAPTTGASVPALPASEARPVSIFLGLAHNGGDLRSGFRTNAGAYNPNGAAVAMVFTLYTADGTVIGSPYVRTWAGYEAYQINDIFAAAGAGSMVTTNAYLIVMTEAFHGAPVLPYVTVIDNQSGDSVFVPPSVDEGPPSS